MEHMTEKRDDFAWLLEVLRGRRENPHRQRGGRQEYETVDQIFERRTARKRTWKTILLFLIEIIPPLLVFIILLLS